jgi:hypothetical protein
MVTASHLSWLRGTTLGSCLDAAHRHDQRLLLNASCSSDEHGAWTLPGGLHSWTATSSMCLRLCSRCHRCQYISMSIAQDHCLWHATCPLQASANASTAVYRVGHVNSELQLTLGSSVNAMVEGGHRRRAAAWLANETVPGACGLFPHNTADCEFANEGVKSACSRPRSRRPWSTFTPQHTHRPCASCPSHRQISITRRRPLELASCHRGMPAAVCYVLTLQIHVGVAPKCRMLMAQPLACPTGKGQIWCAIRAATRVWRARASRVAPRRACGVAFAAHSSNERK